MLDHAGITEQRAALRRGRRAGVLQHVAVHAARPARSRASQQQLRADFEDYLDGFSPNVQDILDNFEFRNQIPPLSKADALGTLIEKFLDPDINPSARTPCWVATVRSNSPAIDNHAMGTVFEELVRRFNEENNEEAGEHWTPRDAVKLMAKLIFLPIADDIESGTYLLYDGACGTGGMLTVAEETLKQPSPTKRRQAGHQRTSTARRSTPRPTRSARPTCCSRARAKAADNIVGGAEWSTLAHDAFPAAGVRLHGRQPALRQELEEGPRTRWAARTACATRASRSSGTRATPSYSLVTRSSDGQMLFLANMASKMNHGTALGSRIAEVHNGCSLFTGDAGQGESNIRRWIIENDWLEAIVALPLNLFYNTGIATYVWVLSNRKPAHRQGQVQLIDATQWFKPLRKNLGKKNCELGRGRHRAHLRHLPRLQGNASSRRSSPTPPSATGRSPSSARCACTASCR
ncbi:MAG: N-6 DNA methylase [Candidatus Manganitrophus sp.]|nr:MAG: N-6 DNA methylase [Candidatus Manganitrophus sp.]